ncbi:hypothetical protein, partial [Klebsiella pneumoniae]|uniref:hypothetical protein n=1 Tax=Klebsiella pneumoniae TaxID=573 RepID=UPI00281281E0
AFLYDAEDGIRVTTSRRELSGVVFPSGFLIPRQDKTPPLFAMLLQNARPNTTEKVLQKNYI